MKKIKNLLNVLKKTSYFKMSLIGMIMLSFLSISCINKKDFFFKAMHDTYVNPYFLTVVFLIFICNAIFLAKCFFKNSAYIIRKKNLSNYLKTMSAYNLVIDLYSFLILLGFTAICVFLRVSAKIDIFEIYKYNINYFVYLVFYFVRTFIIIFLFINMINYIFLLPKKYYNIIYIVICVLAVVLVVYPYNYSVVTLGDFHIFIGYYLIPLEYSSFSLELLFSVGIIMILYSCNIIIDNLFEKFIRGYNV